MKKRNTVFQHLDLYVRLSAQTGVRLKKRNAIFQHLDLFVRLCAQTGVRLKNKFFNRKFVLAHHKLDMHKERVQE